MRKNRGGFTLVELMVVAIIVAILASVAIPLMTGNRKRAMATEAESGLGTVRSCLRAMYAQTGAYNKDLNGDAIAAADPVIGTVPGVSAGDLDGRYFDDAAYSVEAIDVTTYIVTATGDNSTAPEAAEVAGIVIKINQDGTITKTGL